MMPRDEYSTRDYVALQSNRVKELQGVIVNIIHKIGGVNGLHVDPKQLALLAGSLNGLKAIAHEVEYFKMSQEISLDAHVSSNLTQQMAHVVGSKVLEDSQAELVRESLKHSIVHGERSALARMLAQVVEIDDFKARASKLDKQEREQLSKCVEGGFQPLIAHRQRQEFDTYIESILQAAQASNPDAFENFSFLRELIPTFRNHVIERQRGIWELSVRSIVTEPHEDIEAHKLPSLASSMKGLEEVLSHFQFLFDDKFQINCQNDNDKKEEKFVRNIAGQKDNLSRYTEILSMLNLLLGEGDDELRNCLASLRKLARGEEYDVSAFKYLRELIVYLKDFGQDLQSEDLPQYLQRKINYYGQIENTLADFSRVVGSFDHDVFAREFRDWEKSIAKQVSVTAVRELSQLTVLPEPNKSQELGINYFKNMLGGLYHQGSVFSEGVYSDLMGYLGGGIEKLSSVLKRMEGEGDQSLSDKKARTEALNGLQERKELIQQLQSGHEAFKEDKVSALRSLHRQMVWRYEKLQKDYDTSWLPNGDLAAVLKSYPVALDNVYLLAFKQKYSGSICNENVCGRLVPSFIEGKQSLDRMRVLKDSLPNDIQHSNPLISDFFSQQRFIRGEQKNAGTQRKKTDKDSGIVSKVKQESADCVRVASAIASKEQEYKKGVASSIKDQKRVPVKFATQQLNQGVVQEYINKGRYVDPPRIKQTSVFNCLDHKAVALIFGICIWFSGSLFLFDLIETFWFLPVGLFVLAIGYECYKAWSNRKPVRMSSLEVMQDNSKSVVSSVLMREAYATRKAFGEDCKRIITDEDSEDELHAVIADVGR